MSTFVQALLKKYVPDLVLDSMMCHGDPFWIERRIVAYVDGDDMRKVWRYVSSYVEEHGKLPPYSESTIKSIADSEGVSINLVERWLDYCYAEAKREPGQSRAPPFRFID